MKPKQHLFSKILENDFLCFVSLLNNNINVATTFATSGWVTLVRDMNMLHTELWM